MELRQRSKFPGSEMTRNPNVTMNLVDKCFGKINKKEYSEELVLFLFSDFSSLDPNNIKDNCKLVGLPSLFSTK